MKKIYLALSAAALLLVSACSTDFVTPRHNSSEPLEDYFNTEARMFEGLVAAYDLAEIDPAKKMAILKEVRAITGLGLAEAKKVVETANSVIKEAAPKADAEALKKKLEELGAKVTLK